MGWRVLQGAGTGAIISAVQAAATCPTGQDPLGFFGGLILLGLVIGGLVGLALGWCGKGDW